MIPSSSHSEDGGLLEELCETLILTIVMVLWKGVAGSDDESWTVNRWIHSVMMMIGYFSYVQTRGEIFSALRYLHRDYDFYLPIVYIERRILELSMETCLNELKINGGKN